MIDRQNPEVSLKAKYRKVVEISIITSLTLHIMLSVLFPRFHKETLDETSVQLDIEIEDIPQTEQFERPPPPARPAMPVESESEDLLDDVTIDPTTIEEFEPIDAPPPPDLGSGYVFIPYDEAPEPIGGYAGIKKRAKYPEIAQEAGIEGTVIVQAFIDERGRVKNTLILKGIPKTGLDEAAMKAVKETRWRPAKQRDRPVAVWISIPIKFTLK